MQKLKLSIISNFIEKKVTGKEIDFLIYISRFQSDAGKVIGVYYKEVCHALGMSYQTFYDVKESLEKKGFISVRRESDIDYDITILNNDFTDKNFKEGYISTRHAIFQSEDFARMKANEKILIMDLMQITYTNRAQWKIGREKFYDRYMRLFEVTKKVIRGYLKSIKKFFFVNSQSFCYTIIPKRHIKARAGDKIKSDELQVNENIIKSTCRRLKMKECCKEEIEDVAKLIRQYKDISEWNKLSSITIVINAVYESLKCINAYKLKSKKEIRELRPKLVHMLIKRELKLV